MPTFNSCQSNIFKTGKLLMIVLVVSLSVIKSDGVRASTLLSVAGSADAGELISTGEAVAVSFTFAEDFENVSIIAPITCVGCEGNAFLMKDNFGSLANIGNLLDVISFDINSSSTIFSNLALDASDYFVVLAIESGFAVWEGSSSAIVSTADDVFYGTDFSASSLASIPPLSDFSPIFGGSAVHYTVTGDLAISEVPIPSVAIIFYMAIISLGVFSFKKTSRAI